MTKDEVEYQRVRGEAQKLAVSLWTKHYRDDAPQWTVLSDTLGALSQISNMVAGMVRPQATEPASSTDICQNCAGQGWEPSVYKGKVPCSFCQPAPRTAGEREEVDFSSESMNPLEGFDSIWTEYASTHGRFPDAYMCKTVNQTKGRLLAWFSFHHDAIRAALLQSTALPERDPSKPAEAQGLFHKFNVTRTDGSDQPGGKHHGCEYFVLDVDHDPHAKPALQAYAVACAQSHPQLSADLIARHGTALPVGELTDEEIDTITGGKVDYFDRRVFARATLAAARPQPTTEESSVVAVAQPVREPMIDGKELWLWQNGDHMLAFEHLYPCFAPGGDPMTLGKPFGKAVFKVSHDRSNGITKKGTV